MGLALSLPTPVVSVGGGDMNDMLGSEDKAEN